jgi:hypothetical protein
LLALVQTKIPNQKNARNQDILMFTPPVRSFSLLLVASLCLRTVAQVPGDEHWDVRFGFPGVDGSSTFAVATKGNDVYVGGDLTLAGSKNLNRVTRWDGTAWSGLGSGIIGDPTFTFVYSLAWKGNELYAGGIFTNAGSVLARGMARWDGTNWAALPGNFNGYIFHVAVNGNDVYVGGVFGIGDDTNTYSLGKFDGANWTTYDSIVSGCVGTFCAATISSILVDGTDIYVGGAFTSINGVPANSVAKWNGSTWSALSTGLSGGTTVFVDDLAKVGSDLIVGGSFTTAGGVAANNIARWNGSAWSSLGSASSTVRKLLASGSQLYAGGSFTSVAGVPASGVARWDGANWNALGAGTSGTVYNLTTNGSGDVVAVGTFTSAGTVGAAGAARWNGATWSAVGPGAGNGMNRAIGFVRAFDQVGTNLYAGGSFSTAGDILASRVARWNGSAWTNLGTGVVGTASHLVRAIAHIGSDVYFAGTFTNMAGLAASNIARWNGTTWNVLGLSVNSNINAITVSGSELYVGGAFTQAGGVSMNRVAKWTGAGWLTLGSGMNSNVVAMATAANGDVYAGGLFTTAGGASANKVAKWNSGSGWTPLGNGINFGSVLAMAISGSNVYVGGNFLYADSIPVNHVARWNGVAWSALGTGIEDSTSSTSPITALAVRGNDLYAGGTIALAGGVVVTAIARWDGTNWSALGSGLTTTPGSPSVFALYDAGDSLYVGGNCVRAGMRPAANLARWIYDPTITLSPARLSGGALLFRATNLLGLKYRLDAASDLPSWNVGASEYSFVNAREFTNSVSAPRQFFRVMAEP